MNSKFVLTDSCGIQEETTYLRFSCLSIRENTEKPVTIYEETNILVGTDKKKIINAAINIVWDGRTAQRIIKFLKEFL